MMATATGPARPARTLLRWRTAIVLALVVLVAATCVYVVGGYLAYQDLSVVVPKCGGPALGSQTPADFTIDQTSSPNPPDISPYRFSDFSEVSFPSRDAGLTIRAWYAPPQQTGGPVVLLVHGFNACRRAWSVLLPAGMLHRAGFGVLIPDLRNHGDSDIDDGRWAGGAKEYRDVLGAWDWLRAKGVPAARIGVFGVSLGAATATIATGEEPGIAATWADSSYASFSVAATEYAESRGYPGWVAGSAVPVGRLLGDTALGTHDPGDEVLRIAGRPFFIVQGLDDTTVRPHNAVDLSIAAAQGGTPVEPWLVPGAAHVRAMLLETDRYDSRLVAFFAASVGNP